MEGKLKITTNYGEQQWCHAEMDENRKTECLCFNCDRLSYCKAAQMGAALCQTFNIAYAVTRCAEFKPHVVCPYDAQQCDYPNCVDSESTYYDKQCAVVHLIVG